MVMDITFPQLALIAFLILVLIALIGVFFPKAAESGQVPVRNPLAKFNGILSRGCMRIAVVGLLGIVAVVIISVVMRYVFNNAPSWGEPIAMQLIILITMFGAAAGVRDAGHIGLDSMLVLLPEKPRLAIEVIIHLFGLLFAALMLYGCSIMGESQWNTSKDGLMGYSFGWYYMPSIVAGVLIALFSIEHIIAIFMHEDVEPSWH